MELDLFIHGVPKGQKIWGKNDDTVYLNNFYGSNSNNEKNKFLIEIRSIKGKNYCYYSYLKCKDVVDYDSRPGGYFGISLRIDQYCTNVIGIYHLLDIIYQRYIVGNLLKEDSNRIKFIVQDFESADAKLKDVEAALMELMKLSLQAIDFQDIPSQPITSAGKLPILSLYDASNEIVGTIVRQNRKVSISSDYPTNKELKIRQEMEQAQSSFARNKEEEIDGLKANLQQEKERYNQLAIESNDLKLKVEQLEKKCKENERRKSVEQLIAELKEPLKNVQDALYNIQKPLKDLSGYATVPVKKEPEKVALDNTCSPKKKKNKHSSSSIKIKGLLLLPIIIVCTLIYLLYCSPEKKYAKYHGEATTGYRIDLQGYSGTGTLELGKEYMVTLQPAADNIKWDIEGAELIQRQGRSWVKATENNKDIKIVCIKDGKPLCTRRLESEDKDRGDK